jgi:hypothetical protein
MPATPRKRLIARLGRNQIDLAGDAIALSELAQAIHSAKDAVEMPLHVPVGTSPHPYTRFAIGLEIIVTEGDVRISEDQGRITIAGSKKKLDVLADNFESAAVSAQGTHMHIEFHPSHFFLEKDSIPLIVNRV